ncbi:MAG: glutaredoxin 3 [Alphaproteobacteria bacterium]
MMHIRIYTTTYCPYCVRAKLLLDKKGLTYQEIDVTNDPKLRQELVQMSGGRMTVPQIFFDERSIGGCVDLYELERTGELDTAVKNLLPDS